MKRYIVEIQDLKSNLSYREIFKASDVLMLDIAEDCDEVFIDVTEVGEDEDRQLKHGEMNGLNGIFKIGDKVRNKISRNKATVIGFPDNREYIEVRVYRGNANHLKAKWKVCNVEPLNAKK